MRHGERLNIRLSAALAAALGRLAKRERVTPSQWIRRAIADAAGISQDDADPVNAPGLRRTEAETRE